MSDLARLDDDLDIDADVLSHTVITASERSRRNERSPTHLGILNDPHRIDVEGIAGELDDWLGEYLTERGFRYHNVVAHPAMIAHNLAKRKQARVVVVKRRTPMGP